MRKIGLFHGMESYWSWNKEGLSLNPSSTETVQKLESEVLAVGNLYISTVFNVLDCRRRCLYHVCPKVPSVTCQLCDYGHCLTQLPLYRWLHRVVRRALGKARRI